MKTFAGTGRLHISADNPQDVDYTIFVKRDRSRSIAVHALLKGLAVQIETGDQGQLTLDDGSNVRVVFTNILGRSARVAVHGFEAEG